MRCKLSRVGNAQNGFRDLSKLGNRCSKDTVVNRRGDKLLATLTDLDMCILNGNSSSDYNGEFTYISPQGASTIDLCTVSKDIKVCSDFKVLDLLHSSHFPILLKLGTQSENKLAVAVRSVKIIKWDPSKYELFKYLMDQKSLQGTACSLTQILDNIFEISQDCELVVERKLTGNRTPRGPIWFDRECIRSKREVAKALKIFRNNKKSGSNRSIKEYLDIYLNKKKEYKELQIETKKAFYDNVVNLLRNSNKTKEFYKAIALYRNGSRANTNTTKVPIETFKDFFEGVFQFEMEHTIETNIKENGSDELDSDFTITELNIAIAKLAKNKAPGSDGVPNEIWKALPDSTRFDLLNSFNVLYNGGEFPVDWAEIIISPLYKKADPAQPQNYRPVSLAKTVLKLYTLLISNRLLDWSAKYKIVSDYQAAYKKKTGCAEHVFVLNVALQYNVMHRKRKVYGLFVDMSQAFDTVSHNRLWAKVNALGVSSKIIRTMTEIYKIAKARVRTNYDISETFPIEKGVLQGETISPILFTMYLEDLIDRYNSSSTMPIKVLNAAIHLLLYADDIILLAYTPAELQMKIEILSKYFAENGLTVNLGKTKFMVFSKKRDKSKYKLTWQGKQIERVKVYIYLGVPFSENLSFEIARQHFFQKAKIALSSLQGIVYKSRLNSFESALALYNSLVRSVLSHCSPIWCLGYAGDFEKLRTNFLKSLFLLPKMTPKWFLRLELDLEHSEIFYLRTVIKFWARVSNKDKESLVNKCYVGIKHMKPSKTNWYTQMNTLSNKWNFSEILKLEEVPGFSEGLILKKLSKMKEINHIESISKDLVSMNSSNFFSLYKDNKTHCLVEEYLNDDYSWQVKQLILQLKLGVSHITYQGKVVKLGYLEKMYGRSEDSKCPLCNLTEETTYHIMFNCTHYNLERKTFLNMFDLQKYNNNDYLRLFCDLDKEAALQYYYFFNSALKRRCFFLGLMNE